MVTEPVTDEDVTTAEAARRETLREVSWVVDLRNKALDKLPGAGTTTSGELAVANGWEALADAAHDLEKVLRRHLRGRAVEIAGLRKRRRDEIREEAGRKAEELRLLAEQRASRAERGDRGVVPFGLVDGGNQVKAAGCGEGPSLPRIGG